MSEKSVEYFLNLKSYYGYTPDGTYCDTTDVNSLQTDLLYVDEVRKLFQKIAAVHNCTRAVIELEGFIVPVAAYNKDGSAAIDILIDMPSALSNGISSTVNSIYGKPGQILGCVVLSFDEETSTSWYYTSYNIAYKSKVYVTNIATISQMHVVLSDAQTGNTILAPIAAYSLMLKITPIFNT